MNIASLADPAPCLKAAGGGGEAGWKSDQEARKAAACGPQKSRPQPGRELTVGLLMWLEASETMTVKQGNPMSRCRLEEGCPWAAQTSGGKTQ